MLTAVRLFSLSRARSSARARVKVRSEIRLSLVVVVVVAGPPPVHARLRSPLRAHSFQWPRDWPARLFRKRKHNILQYALERIAKNRSPRAPVDGLLYFPVGPVPIHTRLYYYMCFYNTWTSWACNRKRNSPLCVLVNT